MRDQYIDKQTQKIGLQWHTAKSERWLWYLTGFLEEAPSVSQSWPLKTLCRTGSHALPIRSWKWKVSYWTEQRLTGQITDCFHSLSRGSQLTCFEWHICWLASTTSQSLHCHPFEIKRVKVVSKTDRGWSHFFGWFIISQPVLKIKEARVESLVFLPEVFLLTA